MTPEIAQNIAKHIRVGNTLRCAAQSEGVHWDTFKFWLRRGEDGDEPYLTFVTLTRDAEAEAERTFVDVLVNNAKDRNSVGDARWALAWLERRRREDWWLRPEPPREASKMTDDELKEVIAEQAEKWATSDPEFATRLLARLKK